MFFWSGHDRDPYINGGDAGNAEPRLGAAWLNAKLGLGVPGVTIANPNALESHEIKPLVYERE